MKRLHLLLLPLLLATACQGKVTYEGLPAEGTRACVETTRTQQSCIVAGVVYLCIDATPSRADTTWVCAPTGKAP